jgi:hypothetical protein
MYAEGVSSLLLATNATMAAAGFERPTSLQTAQRGNRRPLRR